METHTLINVTLLCSILIVYDTVLNTCQRKPLLGIFKVKFWIKTFHNCLQASSLSFSLRIYLQGLGGFSIENFFALNIICIESSLDIAV